MSSRLLCNFLQYFKINNFWLMVSVVILTSFAYALSAYAQGVTDLFGGQGTNFQSETGLGSNDPIQVATALISLVLNFIGILMVAIIIFAGFKWMVSGGNEDKISEAKKTLASAIVGLIIILSAWGLAQFVINTLLEVTGVGGI